MARRCGSRPNREQKQGRIEQFRPRDDSRRRASRALKQGALPSGRRPFGVNTTLLEPIKTVLDNLPVIIINFLLIPYGFDIIASETRPRLRLNITKALINGHNFNDVASSIVQKFEADEGGVGITLFVPIDTAFTELPMTESL
ncbi:hypothetical protein NL676_028795 [Syzygium grande]|nr:hypothetical protein NL676_028795 [Syzygium grande]